MPSFPYTEVKSMSRWTNYTGTLPECSIPVYCTPDVPGEVGEDAPRRMIRHGAALSAILEHCESTPDCTVRALGSKWSFSRIIQPGHVVIDPANMNVLLKVKPDWLGDRYRNERAAQGFVPVFAQGGTQISSINRRLAQSGLALQTSGAGDGHRLAGCIATGTHGSALGIGAVHDTVLGMHLIVGSNDSVLLQPETAPACGPEVADWLERETGMPTRCVLDDDQFAAAQVSLGSLGFVHGVILETAPLYALRGRKRVRKFGDAEVWRTLKDLDTQRLHPDIQARPYHFEVLFHPYPSSNKPGAFVVMYWKESADEVDVASPAPVAPDLGSDLMGLIANIGDTVDGSIATWALRLLISDQLESRYKPGEIAPRVPGMVWGPTTLPPGYGASTEVVVPQRFVDHALEILYDILKSQADEGNHLLGPVAVRFTPGTQALVGMNIHEMNAFIELPSVRNQEVLGIYKAWWDALAKADIPYTCHWGQLHGMTPSRVQAYFGERATRWKAAREKILPSDTARRMFGSALLKEVGLDTEA